MQKLYLDCDGVILDTINKSYQMLREEGITKEDEVRAFYSNICWEKLIVDAGEIDDSISKIKELTNYFDISILTHVNTRKEALAKIEYFSQNLPGIEVITVPKGTEKADAVDARGAILVDDFLPNLKVWEASGGVPIKFSDSGKKCSYTVITDLLDLLTIDKKIKTKVKE